MRLKVSNEQAIQMLESIPHKTCRGAIQTRWRVTPEGVATTQSVLWLFCWAKTGMNSPDAAAASREVFNRFFITTFADFDGRVRHESATRVTPSGCLKRRGTKGCFRLQFPRATAPIPTPRRKPFRTFRSPIFRKVVSYAEPEAGQSGLQNERIRKPSSARLLTLWTGCSGGRLRAGTGSRGSPSWTRFELLPPGWPLIEPLDEYCFQIDRCELPTRIHAGHPVRTHLELVGMSASSLTRGRFRDGIDFKLIPS